MLGKNWAPDPYRTVYINAAGQEVKVEFVPDLEEVVVRCTLRGYSYTDTLKPTKEPYDNGLIIRIALTAKMKAWSYFLGRREERRSKWKQKKITGDWTRFTELCKSFNYYYDFQTFTNEQFYLFEKMDEELTQQMAALELINREKVVNIYNQRAPEEMKIR